MNGTTTQGARATVSPGAPQAEIFGLPGPSQAEVFGAPTSGTYWGDRRHWGRRPRMPRWYAVVCDGWSRAAWHGEITWEHAATLVEVWHPIVLEQALTPGRKRRPDKEQRIELELYAGLLACGVDELTARHLVGLDEAPAA